MSRRPEPLFPGDLGSPEFRPAPGEEFELAGRVVGVDSTKLALGDAIHSVSLIWDRNDDSSSGALETIAPGHFVRARARRVDDGYRLVSLVEHQATIEISRSGELDRLALGRGKNIVARSRALAAVRRFFAARHFLEVETPTFVPSPGLDPHVHSLAPVVRGERVDHLITSPEFHMKRLLVGGLPRIFQVARCYRAEELGPLHEPEFTLVEWYRAFADFESMLDDTERLIVDVARALQAPFNDESNAEPELIVNSWRGRHTLALTLPFPRVSVEDAFREWAHVDDVFSLLDRDPDAYFQALVDHVEPALAAFDTPVFLIDFPTQLAALARKSPRDARVAERFELYAGGVELSNGYGELTDPAEQRARFEAEICRRQRATEPLYPLDERFLAALEEGLPRAAGNALGLERLIALCLGLPDIRSTLAFADDER